MLTASEARPQRSFCWFAAIQTSMAAMESPEWEVRNAACLAYASATVRALGYKDFLVVRCPAHTLLPINPIPVIPGHFRSLCRYGCCSRNLVCTSSSE